MHIAPPLPHTLTKQTIHTHPTPHIHTHCPSDGHGLISDENTATNVRSLYFGVCLKLRLPHNNMSRASSLYFAVSLNLRLLPINMNSSIF